MIFVNRPSWRIAIAAAALAIACGDKDGSDTGADTTTTQADATAGETAGTSSAEESGGTGGGGSSDSGSGGESSGGGSGDAGGDSSGGGMLPPCENANDQNICEADINCQWDPGPPGRGMCTWACTIVPDEATCMQLEDLCSWDGRACVPLQ